MASSAQSGYTRCFFSADVALITDSKSDTGAAVQQSIVLCIDRVSAGQHHSVTDNEFASDVVANTFEAAIALAEQDPLLQYVSSWLKQDMEWRPLYPSSALAIDVTLSSVHTAEHRIGLSFGHIGPDLPLPPTELDELVIVQEHKKTLSVCLAQLHLSAEDQRRLQPGSCIVLPDTFKDMSKIGLFDMRTEKIVQQVNLDRRQNSLVQLEVGISCEQENRAQIEAVRPVDLTTETLTRVYLQRPVVVDMSIKSKPIVLAPLAGQAVVIQSSGPDGLEEYLAHLIEVGSGLVALLEGVQ